MTRRTKTPLAAAGLAAAAVVTGCASLPPPDELDRQAQAMMQASFRDQGIAKVDRIRQDLGQSACSSDQPPGDDVAEKIMQEARATVKWPAGGNYLGDWREGEKLAQSGRGMTWTDSSTAPQANGGNCYNCHQISAEEISHGTIGPSLYRYGRNRGITSFTSPTVQPIFEYTWMKLWNSKTYNACSNMPRFGHAGLLDETQLRHIMALLLDPASPVNR